jgi:hypothetical protein
MKIVLTDGAGLAINTSSMRYTLSDKLIAYLTLFSGLIISAVAIWYSVAGLMAIFAAAAIPIMIMGVALEGSKLIATIWLKWNWHRAPLHIKAYLISAIAVLMIITSMGIFGFLSKAHLDQAIPTGDVVAQVSLIDEKINNEREVIANARTLIKQLDDAVTGIQSGQGREIRNRDGTTRIENPAERALQIRRAQANDRAALTKTIDEAQARIVKLQEEKAPIAGQLREVEAKVGPIKYIAALIYGDDSEHNNLESAVRWVIIVIVLVFDPLAVVLLLASQYSFQWFRQEKEASEEQKEQDVDEFFTKGKLVARGLDADEEARLADEANAKIAEIEKEIDVDLTLASVEAPAPNRAPLTADSEKSIKDDEVEKWNKMVAEAEKAVEAEKELEDHEILNNAHETEKEAMRLWKEEHPSGSLKHQRKLLERGIISELPWENHLRAKADFTDDDAAEEAAKWAMEQVEKKKDLTYVDKEGKDQVVKSVSYEQNAEQSPNTLWARIKDKKGTNE